MLVVLVAYIFFMHYLILFATVWNVWNICAKYKLQLIDVVVVQTV